MTSLTSKIARWCCQQLESSLLPIRGGILYTLSRFFYQVIKAALFLPLALAASLLAAVVSMVWPSGKSKHPRLLAFARHPQWTQKPLDTAPVDIGFSTADFQENGPQGHPHTNWTVYYRQHRERVGPIGQVPDLWNHPEHVFSRLEELGVKRLRFSISRDKIEPQLGGPWDQEALEHYRSFCRELRRRHIQAMVTLQHFSDPVYFSWDRPEDIDGFVRYAEAAGNFLYDEGIRRVVTLNEPTIAAFQGWVRGQFPPCHRLDFEGAGSVLENMMRAHSRVYEVLKARHPDLEIGISHEPVRFRPYHTTHPFWTPIENIVCHYMTEVSHSALLRFFQTGKFSLKVPFLANHTFEMEGGLPLDFIGLQYYTDPLLKFSLTKGESVSHDPDEKMSAYRYRVYPQGLASALEELRSLGVPIDITEVGIDTRINTDATDKERIRYFDRIFQVVQLALEEGLPVRSLHFWTLVDNLEWDKAWAVRFGFYSFDSNTGEITPRAVTQWLKERLAGRVPPPGTLKKAWNSVSHITGTIKNKFTREGFDC